MKLYFVSINNEKVVLDSCARCILLTYYGRGNYERLMKSGKEVFLDSGAFVFSKKKVIPNLDEYIAFIKHYQTYIKVYANMDVIGDAEETLKNQLYLEKKGLKPLPVYHYGEDKRFLEYYVNNYDYIALGGYVRIRGNKRLVKEWFDACFKIIKDKCKVHGFGVGSFSVWVSYPFYSVDNTSYIWAPLHKKELRTTSQYGKHRMRVNNVIIDKRLMSYDDRIRLYTNYYQKLADIATDIWRKRGIYWDD